MGLQVASFLTSQGLGPCSSLGVNNRTVALQCRLSERQAAARTSTLRSLGEGGRESQTRWYQDSGSQLHAFPKACADNYPEGRGHGQRQRQGRQHRTNTARRSEAKLR